MDDWRGDAPGVRRLIRPSDLPPPVMTVADPAEVIEPPSGVAPRVPAGYKVVRVRMENGWLTGEYDDSMTGFVLGDNTVWERPADIAVTRDGALLVTDDANGTILQIARR